MSDDYFISEALKIANGAFSRGDFPVGAILTIDDLIIGAGSNRNASEDVRSAHAETTIIVANSAELKKAQKAKKTISLYTTLEPCLMCIGISVLHRVSRIVYACPDPHGGATFLNPDSINTSGFYQRKWPEIVRDVHRQESYDLLVRYMKNQPGWENVLASFEKMKV